MFGQKFAFSLVGFVHFDLPQFHFDFLLFFRFFGSDFFLNGFAHPFIVYSRPSFLFEPNFHFSLVVLCLYAAF